MRLLYRFMTVFCGGRGEDSRMSLMLSQEVGLADLLNYAHLVEEGVIVNKDGAFLKSFVFTGPDLSAKEDAERVALLESINRALLLLDDGWMLHVDEIRLASPQGPLQTTFPEPLSQLLEEERHQWYQTQGQPYENVQYLTLVWKWPLKKVRWSQRWFLEGGMSHPTEVSLTQWLPPFLEKVERVVALLAPHGTVAPLSTTALLRYLAYCIQGSFEVLLPPPEGGFLDATFGQWPVVGGYVPRVGKRHVYALSLLSYQKPDIPAGLLEGLGTYPLSYRWSTRFMALSTSTAEKELKRYQKNWHNQVKGLVGLVKEAISGTPATNVNVDAVLMKEETQEALLENAQQHARFGFWTSTVLLMHENEALLQEAETVLSHYLERQGFRAYREDVNAMEAWLGSIPGHGALNARWLFLSSRQAAWLFPLQHVWSGREHSAKESLLPPQSPPVFQALTTGKTPFRFHLDAEGVGHQLVIGPTGAGKSTYLQFLIAQFLRYPEATVWVFDKHQSHQAWIEALQGRYACIQGDERPLLAPFQHLESETQRLRAARLVEEMVALQGIDMTPAYRQSIFQGVESLRVVPTFSRSLTALCSKIQDVAVRDALRYYTAGQGFPLLDALEDHFSLARIQGLDASWLLEQPAFIATPVLQELFNRVENDLEARAGQTPTLIVIEEAWLYLRYPLFASRLLDWLKTLRKFNARVVLATQSLSDLYNPETHRLTAVTSALLEATFVRVLLPNPFMDKESERLYEQLGLNVKERALLRNEAEPKRHYYVMTTEGCRLIELGLEKTPVARALLGLSKGQANVLLDFLHASPLDGVAQYLEAIGLPTAAKRYRELREA